MPTDESDAGCREQVREALLGVLGDLTSYFGRPPSIVEVAELFSRSLPFAEPRIDMGHAPAELVVMGAGRRVRGDVSLVDDLPDDPFVKAADLFGLLLPAAGETPGPTPVSQLVEVLTDELRNLPAGLSGDQHLVVTGPRAKRRPKLGDVVAIPAKPNGYYLAVILTRNRFGTAYGLFRGRRPVARIPGTDDEAYPFPVYSDEQSVLTGAWRVVGNGDALRRLFPEEPEIYHMNGIAETSAGNIRAVPDDEAERVGMLDNTYDQGYLSEYLQTRLTEGFFR